MAVTNELAKVTVYGFLKKFMLLSKWGKWVIFDPKSTLSKISLNRFIRFFLK